MKKMTKCEFCGVSTFEVVGLCKHCGAPLPMPESDSLNIPHAQRPLAPPLPPPPLPDVIYR